MPYNSVHAATQAMQVSFPTNNPHIRATSTSKQASKPPPQKTTTDKQTNTNKEQSKKKKKKHETQTSIQIDEKSSYPESWFCCKFSMRSSVIIAISSGIGPVNKLSETSRCRSRTHCAPREGGIGPDSWFWFNRKSLRCSNRPNSAGISPSKLLWDKSSISNAASPPSPG